MGGGAELSALTSKEQKEVLKSRKKLMKGFMKDIVPVINKHFEHPADCKLVNKKKSDYWMAFVRGGSLFGLKNKVNVNLAFCLDKSAERNIACLVHEQIHADQDAYAKNGNSLYKIARQLYSSDNDVAYCGNLLEAESKYIEHDLASRLIEYAKDPELMQNLPKQIAATKLAIEGYQKNNRIKSMIKDFDFKPHSDKRQSSVNQEQRGQFASAVSILRNKGMVNK